MTFIYLPSMIGLNVWLSNKFMVLLDLLLCYNKNSLSVFKHPSLPFYLSYLPSKLILKNDGLMN